MSKLPIADFVNQDSKSVVTLQPVKVPSDHRCRVLLFQVAALITLILIYPAVMEHTHAVFSDHSRLSQTEEIILLCPKVAMVVGGLWLVIEIVIGWIRRRCAMKM